MSYPPGINPTKRDESDFCITIPPIRQPASRLPPSPPPPRNDPNYLPPGYKP